MSRLPLVEPDQAPEHVAAELREMPPTDVIRTIAYAGDVMAPWSGFAAALTDATALDPVLREIATLRVAALSPGADHNLKEREISARNVGASDAQIDGARSGTGLEGDDELIASFTEEVVRDGSPSAEIWEQADRRLDPQEIVELLLVIGHSMMIARLYATFQLDPDPPAITGPSDDPSTAS